MTHTGEELDAAIANWQAAETQADATASDILIGKSAVVAGGLITGTMALPTLESVTANGATTPYAISITNETESSSADTGALLVAGGVGVGGSICADQVYGAVWNDYAEFREAGCDFSPGDCMCESVDGKLRKSAKRRQKCALIVSDTFGFSIGRTESATCPVAVAGWVLATPKHDRRRYKLGDVVCAGAGGAVVRMRWWERVLFPDRMIGVVSSVPNCILWGKKKIPVNGRIWIKIK